MYLKKGQLYNTVYPYPFFIPPLSSCLPILPDFVVNSPSSELDSMLRLPKQLGTPPSISLLELTQLCSELTGNNPSVNLSPETHPADIPYCVINNSQVTTDTGWKPRKSMEGNPNII